MLGHIIGRRGGAPASPRVVVTANVDVTSVAPAREVPPSQPASVVADADDASVRAERAHSGATSTRPPAIDTSPPLRPRAPPSPTAAHFLDLGARSPGSVRGFPPLHGPTSGEASPTAFALTREHSPGAARGGGSTSERAAPRGRTALGIAGATHSSSAGGPTRGRSFSRSSRGSEASFDVAVDFIAAFGSNAADSRGAITGFPTTRSRGGSGGDASVKIATQAVMAGHPVFRSKQSAASGAAAAADLASTQSSGLAGSGSVSRKGLEGSGSTVVSGGGSGSVVSGGGGGGGDASAVAGTPVTRPRNGSTQSKVSVSTAWSAGDATEGRTYLSSVSASASTSTPIVRGEGGASALRGNLSTYSSASGDVHSSVSFAGRGVLPGGDSPDARHTEVPLRPYRSDPASGQSPRKWWKRAPTELTDNKGTGGGSGTGDLTHMSFTVDETEEDAGPPTPTPGALPVTLRGSGRRLSVVRSGSAANSTAESPDHESGSTGSGGARGGTRGSDGSGSGGTESSTPASRAESRHFLKDALATACCCAVRGSAASESALPATRAVRDSPGHSARGSHASVGSAAAPNSAVAGAATALAALSHDRATEGPTRAAQCCRGRPPARAASPAGSGSSAGSAYPGGARAHPAKHERLSVASTVFGLDGSATMWAVARAIAVIILIVAVTGTAAFGGWRDGQDNRIQVLAAEWRTLWTDHLDTLQSAIQLQVNNLERTARGVSLLDHSDAFPPTLTHHLDSAVWGGQNAAMGIGDTSTVEGIAFVRHVAHDEREAFESSLSSVYGRDLSITRVGRAASIRTVEDRDHYLPVVSARPNDVLVMPLEGVDLLGVGGTGSEDVSYDDVAKATAAYEPRTMIVTKPVALVGRYRLVVGLVPVFAPPSDAEAAVDFEAKASDIHAYHGDDLFAPPATSEERLDRLLGFVTSLIDVPRMLTSVLGPAAADEHHTIVIEDVTSAVLSLHDEAEDSSSMLPSSVGNYGVRVDAPGDFPPSVFAAGGALEGGSGITWGVHDPPANDDALRMDVAAASAQGVGPTLQDDIVGALLEQAAGTWDNSIDSAIGADRTQAACARIASGINPASFTSRRVLHLGGAYWAIHVAATSADYCNRDHVPGITMQTGAIGAGAQVLSNPVTQGTVAGGIAFTVCCMVVFLWRFVNAARLHHEERLLSITNAQRVEQEKSILSYASHELRNPCHSIAASAEFLRDAVPADSPLRPDVDAIAHAVVGMRTLLDDVLDLSKLRAGKISLEMSEVRVRRVIRQLAVQNRAFAHVPIEVEVDGNVPPRLYTEDLRLRQLVSNGLTNACKFTGSGKITVRVYVSHDHDTIVYKVIDTGVGLGGMSGDTLFEPFRQASRTHTSSAGATVQGTGLGLPICKMLARALHGDVGLYDRELGPDRHNDILELVPDVVMGVDTPTGHSGIGVDMRATGARAGSGAVFWVILPILPRPGQEIRSQFTSPRGATAVFSDISDADGGGKSDSERNAPDMPRASVRVDVSRPSKPGAASAAVEHTGPPRAPPPVPTSLGRSSSVHDSKRASPIGTLGVSIAERSPILGLHFLVVDDDSLNRRLAQRMLQGLGATATLLDDGDQIVPHLREHHPSLLKSSPTTAAATTAAGASARARVPASGDATDSSDAQAAPAAILLDIIMKRTKGTDVCRELRTVHGVTLPILAVTGNASAADEAQYRRVGFDDVVGKPFSKADLARVLSAACPPGRVADLEDEDSDRDAGVGIVSPGDV